MGKLLCFFGFHSDIKYKCYIVNCAIISNNKTNTFSWRKTQHRQTTLFLACLLLDKQCFLFVPWTQLTTIELLFLQSSILTTRQWRRLEWPITVSSTLRTSKQRKISRKKTTNRVVIFSFANNLLPYKNIFELLVCSVKGKYFKLNIILDNIQVIENFKLSSGLTWAVDDDLLSRLWTVYCLS